MARLGGMPIDERLMVDMWHRTQRDRALRAALREAAAFGAHIAIGDLRFEDIFDNPSPFITDDSF
ncbi:hypothetical protein [Hasllibacter sp. MH4015]|uniref:hypothetical protein n=1 Tax=Hasllibacter sp. MH4015 TaxID=2854029 RepID=UPI001CD6FB50|nr:hypothetical protein [Hasllibacter sp. MH4015]